MPGLAHLIDPLPLLAVLIGSFGVALLQIGRESTAAAFAALPALLRADPDADRDRARASVNEVDKVAQLQGLQMTDRVKARTGFLAQAMHRIAQCPDIARFEIWIRQAISDRAERHQRVVAFWDAVADTAPAIGMGCTILGLVAMFARMDDPSSIGQAMAVALLATFHGMVTANLIAGPIARRLEALSAREIAWQTELADRLVAIARRERTDSADTPAPPHRKPTPRRAA